MGVSTQLFVCVCQLVSGLQSCDWCWQVLLPSETHAHTHWHLIPVLVIQSWGSQGSRITGWMLTKIAAIPAPLRDEITGWCDREGSELTRPHLGWSLFSRCGQRKSRDKENLEGGPGEVTDDEVSRPVRLKYNTKDKKRSHRAEKTGYKM